MHNLGPKPVKPGFKPNVRYPFHFLGIPVVLGSCWTKLLILGMLISSLGFLGCKARFDQKLSTHVRYQYVAPWDSFVHH